MRCIYVYVYSGRCECVFVNLSPEDAFALAAVQARVELRVARTVMRIHEDPKEIRGTCDECVMLKSGLTRIKASGNSVSVERGIMGDIHTIYIGLELVMTATTGGIQV